MILRIFAIAILALLPSARAQSPAQDPTARMQQVIRSYVDNKTFMGTVLVVKDGKPLINEGYGSADLEWKIPNSPAVKFRLGSLTKQFTAASILLLEERGKLKVEDPVSKHMSDAPAAWEKITIYNLLTHTSGIPNFTGFPDYRSTEWKDTTPAELVARFRDKPLDFEPGSKFSYSNSGYVLLGYLLEKISGQTYGDFLQQNIFTSLAACTGLSALRPWHPKRRLYQYDDTFFCGRDLFNYGRPTEMGAGTVRRQGASTCVADKNDYAVQGRLRVRPLSQHKKRPQTYHSRRRHRRLQYLT
jgi:CubicO group peptidase (beta-lactamase class C family)